MNLRIIFLLLLTAAGTLSANEAKIGTSGAQFLAIGVGSRYQGMGEAAVATVNDVYGAFWNPAGLASIEKSAVGFTNVNWLLDLDLNYVAVAHHFEDVGVFALSTSVLSGEKQEITTFEDQDGTGQFFSTTSYAFGISYARQVTAKFAFGGTVKYVGEKIHLVSSGGVAFDFGTLLTTGYRSLRIGMSISNMGQQLRFSGPGLDVKFDELGGSGANDAVDASLKTTPYSLPLIFRVGLAYDLPMGPKSKTTLSAELKHPNDNVQKGAFGAEWSYDDRFFLRGGYKLNYDEEKFSLGGGMTTPISGSTSLVIDYSWQDFGRLESAQRFSVGFAF